MKTFSHRFRIKLNLLAVTALIFTSALSLFAQDEEDRTNSPYFVVSCPDSTTDRLPLKQTSAEVTISGVIADVTVRQTYCNEGENVLEAIYVFPGSTRAAVYAMNMQIGERTLYAIIMEKDEARETYEEAKEEGKTTSLLEQDRPNVFRMSVANILPGDTIHIEMKYTELLVPLEGQYEFVYPTVVGPRYVSPSEDSASTAFAGTPFTPEGEPPLYDFSINVKINSGIDMKELTCPSHDSVEIELSGNTATCELLSRKEGNRDFILHYRLSGDHMESGLLLFEGADENFFLAMIQPPAYPTESDIPPREYVFIMDVSGSMRGFPIDISKTLLENLIGQIRESDRFNVVFFAGGSNVLSSASLPATSENRQLAIDMIDSQEGGGGTELLNALNTALNLPGTADFSRSFIIATDGYVTVERQAFDFIRNNLGDANFFPFGIGTSVNRYIIEGMAHVGFTEPVILTDSEEAPDAAEKFRQYIQYPVLTNIETSYDGFEVYDIEPVSIPDVLAQRPVIIFGKWRGQPAGTITLTGNSGNEVYRESLDVTQYTPSDENSALRYLWARKRIQLLDDYCSLTDGFGTPDSALIREVTELGLKYNLLTQYTSFVAVDSTIRNEGDSITTVTQPLPLPEGVPDEAVGRYNGYVGTYDLLSAEKSDGPPAVAELYPNPFRESLTLILNLGKEDLSHTIQVTITDLTGKLVHSLQLDDLKEGSNTIVFSTEGDIPGLTSGIYIVRIKSGTKVLSRIRVMYLGN